MSILRSIYRIIFLRRTRRSSKRQPLGRNPSHLVAAVGYPINSRLVGTHHFMTTRSGRGYKRPEMEEYETGTTGVEEQPADRAVMPDGNATPGTARGADIMSLMELLLEDRRRREEEITEERVRRERESERRAAEMKEQMEAMFRLVERTTKGKKDSGEALVKVAKLTDSDDIEGYLVTFERQMTAYEIDQSRWAFILAPHLTGRAQKAYMALANDDANDYYALKQAILKRYDINEETHRRKFRERSHGKGESYTELATSLVDLANRWLEECSTKAEVLEKIAIEHFLAKAPEDVRVWVREHKPKTCAEAGYWADEFQQARNDASLPSKIGPRRCHNCHQVGHLASNCPMKPRDNSTPRPGPSSGFQPGAQRSGMAPPKRSPPQQPSKQYTSNRPVQCYSCGQTGHIAAYCRANCFATISRKFSALQPWREWFVRVWWRGYRWRSCWIRGVPGHW